MAAFIDSVHMVEKFPLRVKEITEEYEKLNGCKPKFVSRAPGRVNIIGEHIDYMGYGVLPMAIGRACIVAIGSKSSDSFKVSISNAKTGFESVHFSFPSISSLVALDLTKKHHWTNYVICGLKGLAMDCKDLVLPKEEWILIVDGDVPIGKGLSSSSAINCASTIAFMEMFGIKFPKNELSKFTQVVERFIGMVGGGMDQAISINGEEKFAKYVEFSPSIRVSPVSLEGGYCFVVSDSMVESNKNETASKNYNVRVVECRLGSALLGHQKDKLEGWNEVKTLWQLQHDLGFKNNSVESLKEMEKLADFLPDKPISLAEVASRLGLPVKDVRNTFLYNKQADVPIKLASEENFKIQDRVKHVFSEARRVLEFIAVTKELEGLEKEEEYELVYKKLGKLMDFSHFSNRDLYEASCEELEKLTKVCRASGALGSRFTGAGWGGCCISLVKEKEAEAFIKKVWEGYYVKEKKDEKITSVGEFLFKTKPEKGATVYCL